MTTATLVRGRIARSHLPAPLTIAAGRKHTAETILRAWREGKSENTIRSYEHDLNDFAMFLTTSLNLRVLDIQQALALLFQQSSPSAHEIVLAFRHYLARANL